MKLYTYWRSTAAYRVRIALNLKGIAAEMVPVNLVADGGQQHAPRYVALNPAHLVPTLVLDDGTPLTQSLAIIDYLEAVRPEPALLPADPVARAHVLAAAHLVAMDIHPVNNLRVVQHLGETFGATPEDKAAWMRHWMARGFDALQAMIRLDTPFAFGDAPGLADICLVAQMYNAHRWGLELAPFGRLCEIETRCAALPAFAEAAPEKQPDAAQA
ncbi:MAG: maleylacetoacetate isomerase [Paracoccaceae bacterium]